MTTQSDTTMKRLLLAAERSDIRGSISSKIAPDFASLIRATAANSIPKMKIPPFVKTLNLSENIGVTTPPTKAATAELFQNVAASLAHSLCTTSDVVVAKN